MAIPSLAEVKASVIAAEIAPFEAAIKAHLETQGTVTYLESTFANKVISRTFPGKVLTDAGVLALIESIEAAGWTDVEVENQPAPAVEGIGQSNVPAGFQVFVSFKPAGTTPPVDPPETP